MQYVYLVSDDKRAIAIRLDELLFAEMQFANSDFSHVAGKGGGAIVLGYKGNMEKVFKYKDRDRLVDDYKELLETLGAIESVAETSSGVARSQEGVKKIEARISGAK